MFKPISSSLRKRRETLDTQKSTLDVTRQALRSAVADVAGKLAADLVSVHSDKGTIFIQTSSKALAGHLTLHTSHVVAELRARGVGVVRLVIR